LQPYHVKANDFLISTCNFYCIKKILILTISIHRRFHCHTGLLISFRCDVNVRKGNPPLRNTELRNLRFCPGLPAGRLTGARATSSERKLCGLASEALRLAGETSSRSLQSASAPSPPYSRRPHGLRRPAALASRFETALRREWAIALEKPAARVNGRSQSGLMREHLEPVGRDGCRRRRR